MDPLVTLAPLGNAFTDYCSYLDIICSLKEILQKLVHFEQENVRPEGLESAILKYSKIKEINNDLDWDQAVAEAKAKVSEELCDTVQASARRGYALIVHGFAKDGDDMREARSWVQKYSKARELLLETGITHNSTYYSLGKRKRID